MRQPRQKNQIGLVRLRLRRRTGTPRLLPRVPTLPLDEVEPDGEPVEPGTGAVPRDGDQQESFEGYEQRAVEFMSAYARPAGGGEEGEWWDEVEPLLSARAREDYASVDPGVVAFTKVSGTPVVIPTDAPRDLLMVVSVPTDAGDYFVEMETTPSGIYVTRLVPPERDQ